MPCSASISRTLCSMSSSSFWSSFSQLRMSPSSSMSLAAAKRTGSPAASAWSSIWWTTAWMQRCTGPGEQKSYTAGRVLLRAVATAMRTSSSTPWFFTAEMGITGMPRAADMALTSMVPPPAVTSSIMFRASTMGMRISSSWSVRYRFRWMLVASTMLMMPSGL